ncbi:glycine zipper domain-containing protein [uncultured Helicobacter sp.]|uniref:glycine zipper domain-containing protein n=1 Tax=uncultured Helicobacter sp. TaxID=175537 RepID=UPI0026072AE2|nr:glycine zipper domain-containing protein [uncultured Helicobacter sp.]
MKQVSFEIIFNVKDGSLQKINKELDSTNKKSTQFKETERDLTKQSSAFGSSISKATLGLGAFGLAAQGLSVLKDVLVNPIKEAIALNAEYENLGNSIASLISINHESITTTGEVLSAQEKWQLSLKQSQQTIDELRESGLELGYSVGDMSDMFKGFYSTAGSSMSLEQAKNVMKAIAAAANVSGVSVDSLKVTLDSLGSGIANTATDFGRFVSAMGLSTEEMSKAKQEGKLYELIMEKLGQLSESAAFSANSYAVSMAKLNSTFDDIKQSAIAPFFDSMKQSLASLTQFLSTHKDTIVSVFQGILDIISTLVSAAGGLVGNFISDKENAAKTQKYAQSGAAGGAAAGAAIGSFVPVIGTAVGALVGGLVGSIGGALIGSFSSSKITTKAKGVELISKATKDNVSAREFADMQKDSKKYWGLKKSSKSWTEYYSASNIALRNIREGIRGYEYLLEDIGGGVKEIVVRAGRYKDYDEILNAGAKELIKSFFEAPSKALKSTAPTPNTDAIYKVWEEYAKSVNKKVSEALSESLNTFITTGQSFQTWLYTYKGEDAKAARYGAELAQMSLERLQEALGAADVNIDNYLSYREEALRENFDPHTIERINALGEALMQSADASKKYEEALKGENKTKLNMIDPYLEKAKKIAEIDERSKDTSEKIQVAMLSTLKQMLRVSQESLEAGAQK